MSLEVKPQFAFSVQTTLNGYICISQHSDVFGQNVEVFITLDQFDLLQSYVKEQASFLEENWNNGEFEKGLA